MSSEIWTGALNDAYRLGGSVGLYDTTLRDGEQTVGVVLDPEQKLEIARLLDELGIDRIEAGFPRVSQDDWRAVELIAGAGLRAEVWGFSRAVPADLEALVELGVPASVIESPISDLKLDAIGVPREKMLDRITSAMQFAAEHGIHAAFFGVDSTRAAPDFYERVYKSAVDAGAKEVVVVDTLGIASPEAVAELRVRGAADPERMPCAEDVVVEARLGDLRGLDRAAEPVVPLEHAHALARACEQRGAREAVDPAADEDRVVVRHRPAP